MWRVVVARPEESSTTLLSSELTSSLPPPPHQHQPMHHHHPQHHWAHPHYPAHPAPAQHLYPQEPSADSQDSQQQQPPRSLKRALSDSECDDVFSEESGKEPCSSPGGDSCQHTSRKRRRGMIEKKRRDRINASLGELRRLVPAAARDPHSGKLEKAEILQLTVEHLRSLRSKGPEAYDSSKLATDYHSVGWNECVAEVGRYLTTMEGLDDRDPLRLRLLSHLCSFHRDPAPPQQQHLQQQQQQSPQQTSSYEPSSSSPPQLNVAQTPTPVHPGALTAAWPAQYHVGPGQYQTQYAQPGQHGKPYRPWGAELAY